MYIQFSQNLSVQITFACRPQKRPVPVQTSIFQEQTKIEKKTNSRVAFPTTLYGGKVCGLIWIRFAAEALRFSFAKSSRSLLKMWKCKVKWTIFLRFKLIQVFATQKSGPVLPSPPVLWVQIPEGYFLKRIFLLSPEIKSFPPKSCCSQLQQTAPIPASKRPCKNAA